MTRARNIAKLVSEQVSGNVNISGILTAATLFGEGSGITGVSPVGSGVTILDGGVSKGSASKIDFADHFTVSNISSGIATITVGVTTEYITSTQINNTGVVTTGSAIVGSAVTINSSGINVGSGIATARRFEIAGLSTITDAGVSVIGVVTASTGIFVDCGITDTLDALGPSNFTLPISANGGINASGIVTCSTTIVGSGVTINSSGINVSGITTSSSAIVGSAVTINSSGINANGIVTASSFRGDGSQLTGMGNTANVSTSTLVVSGVSTFAGVSTISNGGYSTIGFVTANSFRPSSGYYQSSNGTNSFYVFDTTGNVAFQGTIGASQINTAAGNKAIAFTASSTPSVILNGLGVSGISTLMSSVGIGTTNPNKTLDVRGDVSISGVITSQHLNVTGITTLSSLDVAFATVEINNGGVDVSGIVTATQGFISVGNTSPVKIQLVGNQLIFNVVGIGSTTLTLA